MIKIPQSVCRMLFTLLCLMSLLAEDTFAEESRNEDELQWCPPYGSTMPPDLLTVKFRRGKRGGPGDVRSDEYPAYIDAYPFKKNDISGIDFGMSGRPYEHWGMPDVFAWGWLYSVPDGHFVPVGGQIYKCDLATRTFTRIPNHPLSIAPAKAVRMLTIPPERELDLTGPQVTLEAKMQLTLSIKQFKRPAAGDSSGGRVRLHMLCAQDRLLSPRSSKDDHDSFDAWVTEGQYIETTYWRLKLVRIVFPDLEHGIGGWADVHVDPPATVPNRTPAPRLPDDE